MPTFGFADESSARRAAAAVRAVEAMTRSGGPVAGRRAGFEPTCVVQVTGAPADGLHPAVVVDLDVEANRWVPRDGTVWFLELNQLTVPAGKRVFARFMGADEGGTAGLYVGDYPGTFGSGSGTDDGEEYTASFEVVDNVACVNSQQQVTFKTITIRSSAPLTATES